VPVGISTDTVVDPGTKTEHDRQGGLRFYRVRAVTIWHTKTFTPSMPVSPESWKPLLFGIVEHRAAHAA
jgi:hypothetical protein